MNYKNMMTSFLRIVRLFKEIGYNVTYQLLDTSDFGIAQTRKRVFIIGYRNDLKMTFDFLRISKEKQTSLKEIIWDLETTQLLFRKEIKK